MNNREDKQLNYPTKRFFERKLKCSFSTSEFRFSAGKLDVLAYNREQKCFHVSEGKLANRTASVGHAIGQLIAYISMLQEDGFDFLNSISKEANLHLTDFTEFLESKTIKVCFYITLPSKQKDKILEPAKLMMNNIGDFGNKIGILFSNGKKCQLEKIAIPINIVIRKKYKRDEFISVIRDKFLNYDIAKILEIRDYNNPNIVQFKEKNGNPGLHFEVWSKKKLRKDKNYLFEIAFHLEWAEAWLKDAATGKRANKIKKQMHLAQRTLKRKGLDFKYNAKWGKAWSKVYTTIKTKTTTLDDEELDDILFNLKSLTEALLPGLVKIKWGRKTNRKEMQIDNA